MVLFLGLLIFACSGKKGLVMVTSEDRVESTEDSVEYELTTFDSRFESWYDLNNSRSMFRSTGFYESWNRRYVAEWNIKTSQDPFFEPIVGYDYAVDYGFELNHKLFYYFQYVERVLKKPIIPGGGPKIMLIN